MKRALMPMLASLLCLNPLSVHAEPLNKAEVERILEAMQAVAKVGGPAALARPNAALTNPDAVAVLRRKGFTEQGWTDRYGQVLAAYKVIEEERAQERSSGGVGSMLGSLLSTQNLSSIGNAAIFDGSEAMGAVGREIAVQEGAAAASQAMGRDGGGELSTVGSAAVQGGAQAAQDAGARVAIDHAARTASDAVSGTHEPKAATVSEVEENRKAVEPYRKKISRLIND